MLIEKRARQDALGPSSPQLMTKPCPVVPVVQSLHLNKVRASDQPCCFSVLWQKAQSPPRGQANHPCFPSPLVAVVVPSRKMPDLAARLGGGMESPSAGLFRCSGKDGPAFAWGTNHALLRAGVRMGGNYWGLHSRFVVASFYRTIDFSRFFSRVR
jgi:hypothetical protein